MSMLALAIVCLILSVNLLISYWNASACGKMWIESKAAGGAVRFLVWCGAIQSAIGFSSVLIFPLMFLVHALAPTYFTDLYFKGAQSLWYLAVIFPALGTGLALTIESWIAAYRERNAVNMGTAAWNTFAQIHNTAGALGNVGNSFSAVREALGSVFSFSGDEGDAKIRVAVIGLLIMVAVVSIATVGGVLITAAIIDRYAGTLESEHDASVVANSPATPQIAEQKIAAAVVAQPTRAAVVATQRSKPLWVISGPRTGASRV
jgi:hypothetical protein